AYTSDFFCADGKSNPMNVEYKDDFFLSAAFGINSANMLRLELSYYRLGKAIEMEGLNQVAGISQKYTSGIDLKGGSINLYLDLVGDRRQPYLLFVPYVMAGIGASQITLDDIAFTDATSTNYTIGGKEQRNQTIIYGAGFTAGLNNYISLDIGYRFYNFGKIKTDVGMSDGSTNYDVQLESDLKAHIVTVGLKLQI
nr:outer membrane beta-barrel protein [bacterium]